MLSADIIQRVGSYIRHQATKSRGAIVDMVAANQTRYLGTISPLTDEAARRTPPGEGEWCVRELTLHVIATQDHVATVIHHASRGEQPPPRDPPGGIGMTIPDEGQPFAALVERLRTTNQAMLETIRNVPESPNLEVMAAHPFFGPLDCLQWSVFQRIHDEDHIQHAARIIAETA